MNDNDHEYRYTSGYLNDSGGVADSQSTTSRYLSATFVGIISGMLVIEAIQLGIAFNYPEESPRDYWGILYWGDHYILRSLWSIVATAWGAFLAGLIARRRGASMGLLSAVPTVVIWALGIYMWTFKMDVFIRLGYDYVSLENKIISIIIPLVSIPLAIRMGTLGQECSHMYGAHIDSKRYSLLGIKWYHYLWIPFYLHFIIIQSAWAVDYGLGWWRIVFLADLDNIWNIIPAIFLAAIIGTLYVTWLGLSRAYDYLSGYSQVYSKFEVVKGVMKYGIGFPFLAAALQVIIVLVHNGLSRLLS